jgi:hypothetical protein
MNMKTIIDRAGELGVSQAERATGAVADPLNLTWVMPAEESEWPNTSR